MAAKKKKVDPIKQREKRSKIAAIVGVVLLVLVAAYEIPSMLKVMNKKPPVGSTYDPGPATTVGGLPNVVTATGAAASPGDLIDTDVPPVSIDGQLVSFTVFETKNPFTPQVSSSPAEPASTDGSGDVTPADSKPGADVPPTGTTATTPSSPSTVVPSTGAPAVVGTVPSTTTPTAPTPAPQPTVAISVNGVVSRVAGQGTFPRGGPVFRLVSWTKGHAQIAIVGGSYATGDPTLTLDLGRPLTLENQTDGKRYKLVLVSTP